MPVAATGCAAAPHDTPQRQTAAATTRTADAARQNESRPEVRIRKTLITTALIPDALFWTVLLFSASY
jgi:hypothetical protein